MNETKLKEKISAYAKKLVNEKGDLPVLFQH